MSSCGAPTGAPLFVHPVELLLWHICWVHVSNLREFEWRAPCRRAPCVVARASRRAPSTAKTNGKKPKTRRERRATPPPAQVTTPRRDMSSKRCARARAFRRAPKRIECDAHVDGAPLVKRPERTGLGAGKAPSGCCSAPIGALLGREWGAGKVPHNRHAARACRRAPWKKGGAPWGRRARKEMRRARRKARPWRTTGRAGRRVQKKRCGAPLRRAIREKGARL